MALLFKSILLIGIFWGFYKLLLERTTFFQWNRFFLLTGIILSLGLPFLVIPVEVFIEKTTQTVSQTNLIPVNNPKKSTWNTSDLLILVYFTGVLFVIIKTLIQSFSLARFLKNTTLVKHNIYDIRTTEKAVAPFSFFKHIIINPEHFSEEEKEQILAHENVHVTQYHTLDIIVMQILHIVQWFNPVVWLYQKSLENNLEYLADSKTQTFSKNPKSYQELILKTSIPNYQYILTNRFNASSIKNRIIMLHKSNSEPSHKWKYALILPILALFIYSFNRVEVEKITENGFDTNIHNTALSENPMDISVTIDKNTTDADLKALKELFKSQDIKLEINQLKRNKENEIIAINIEVSSKDFNASYMSNSDEPIAPVLIHYNFKSNQINIGNVPPPPPAPEMVFIKKGDKNDAESMNWTTQEGQDKKMIIVKNDGNNHTEKHVEKIIVMDGDSIKEENITINWVGEDGKTLNVSDDKAKKYVILIEDDGKGQTTYKVNGKEVSKEELDKLETDEIKEVNVIKKKNVKDSKEE